MTLVGSMMVALIGRVNAVIFMAGLFEQETGELGQIISWHHNELRNHSRHSSRMKCGVMWLRTSTYNVPQSNIPRGWK
jgi:hypothetical protein